MSASFFPFGEADCPGCSLDHKLWLTALAGSEKPLEEAGASLVFSLAWRTMLSRTTSRD